jgi:hypothetical protein
LPSQAPEGAAPRFQAGDRVRVKEGTRDPDFADFPLGGWAGVVHAVDPENQPPMYEVVWNDATLKLSDPVYEQRCERDGLDSKRIWLTEDCLVPDSGGPLSMEIPRDLTPRPLRLFDQEDRIRDILGLTSDEPLPSAGEEELELYHGFLAERLSFPFQAEVWVQSGPFAGRMQRVTIHRMLGPSEEGTSRNGLLIEASLGEERVVIPLCDLEAGADSPHRRMLQDYAYWYLNFGDGSGGVGLQEDEDKEPATTTSILQSLLRYSVYGMGLGAVLGALLATQGTWGVTALALGAAGAAVLGWFMGSRYGLLFGAVNRVRGGPAVGGVLGLIAGAVVGGSLGVFLVGCLGTIPGSIAGNLLGKGLDRFKIRPWSELVWIVIGACIGGIILALVQDPELAVPGALTGAMVGGICTAVLFLFVVVSLGLMLTSRE